MSKKQSAGAALAAIRWAKPEADRTYLREAGKLGGRPRSCECGQCPKCKARIAQAKWRAGKRGNDEQR